MLRESARDAPNRGRPFSFDQFQRLMTAKWNPLGEVDFVSFLQKKFFSFSFLLGALRTTQFDRFRCGGLEKITDDRFNLTQCFSQNLWDFEGKLFHFTYFPTLKQTLPNSLPPYLVKYSGIVKKSLAIFSSHFPFLNQSSYS